MTFTSNRIAAGPTYTRQRLKAVTGRITPVIPPTISYIVNDEGNVELIPQDPEREGQMVFYRNPANVNPSDTFVTMYVVVTINGELIWKRVSNPTGFGDPRTGQDYNQNASFFSPLAS